MIQLNEQVSHSPLLAPLVCKPSPGCQIPGLGRPLCGPTAHSPGRISEPMWTPPLLWPLLGLQVLIRWLLFPSYLTPCGSLFRAWLVLGLFWPFNLQFVFNESCSPWGFVFEVSMRGGELCVLFPSHVDLLLRLCSCFSSPFPFLPQSPAPESTPLTDRLNKNPHLRLSFRRTTVR